jgi:formylglycine-generating enzyme required for sulfatase activity
LTGAVAAVALALAGGTTVSYLKFRDAEYHRSLAEGKQREALRQADRAKKARDFLVSIFRIAETDVQGGNVTARQILADAEKRIPIEFADNPTLCAELLAAIEEVNHTIRLSIPTAMILEAKGSIRILSARGINRPPVAQALLFPEDRLELGSDAFLRLYFLTDLHQEQLKPDQEVILGRKGCEPADAVSKRTQDILMTFVRLPKGTFHAGWDGTKKGVRTEIKEDFEIAVHPVTQGQWHAVMGNNPSWYSRNGQGMEAIWKISDEELQLFPVEMVTWDEVQQFLKKLNEKERGKGFLYRLPTEVEWEYACRGGCTSEEDCSHHFYFASPTNDLSAEQANFNGENPAGDGRKGKWLRRTTRVGAYPPNRLGLCDMHGNVWQLCSDPWDPKLSESYGVGRGGSWITSGSSCRAAERDKNDRSERYSDLGFRLVREPVQKK